MKASRARMVLEMLPTGHVRVEPNNVLHAGSSRLENGGDVSKGQLSLRLDIHRYRAIGSNPELPTRENELRIRLHHACMRVASKRRVNNIWRNVHRCRCHLVG